MSAGSPFGMLGAGAAARAPASSTASRSRCAGEKLRARVARHVPAAELARVAEFLGELVGAPFPDDDERAAPRRARRTRCSMGDQMRRACEDFVARRVRGAAAACSCSRICTGATCRRVQLRRRRARAPAGSAARWCSRSRGPRCTSSSRGCGRSAALQEIRLGELTRKAQRAAGARRCSATPSTDDVVARIVERAGGNAFYLEELIRAVAEGKGDALPETVLAMVQARLEALDAEARRVLRAASVFGQAFWRGGVRALLGGDGARRPTSASWLDELVEREVVVRARRAREFPGEDEYAFRHALVREAAYAMLTDDDRALGHRLAGEWLERAGERDAMVLAEHFERGGEPRARGRPGTARAAEQALEGNDFAAAARARRARHRVRRDAARRCGALCSARRGARLARRERRGRAPRPRRRCDALPAGERRSGTAPSIQLSRAGAHAGDHGAARRDRPTSS